MEIARSVVDVIYGDATAIFDQTAQSPNQSCQVQTAFGVAKRLGFAFEPLFLLLGKDCSALYLEDVSRNSVSPFGRRQVTFRGLRFFGNDGPPCDLGAAASLPRFDDTGPGVAGDFNFDWELPPSRPIHL